MDDECEKEITHHVEFKSIKETDIPIREVNRIYRDYYDGGNVLMYTLSTDNDLTCYFSEVLDNNLHKEMSEALGAKDFMVRYGHTDS